MISSPGTPRRASRIAVVAALAISATIGSAVAADHRDGPRVTANISNANLDILDLYAFQSPTNRNNSVLIMTLSTAAGVISPSIFSPTGLYEFKITGNIGGGVDASTTATYQVMFGPSNSVGRQGFVVARVDASGSTILGRGNTGTKAANLKGGGRIAASLFDDPFFFDLGAFNKFKALALGGDPTAGAVFLNRNGNATGANIPNNFFGGFNCLAIVLEVPSIHLQASRANSKTGVWARTLLADGSQFDRKGRPGINTVLIPDASKDAFNSGTPETDAQFRPIASEELRLLFGTPEATRTSQVNLLLPDVLTFDTRSSAGFTNGRKLDDDVIDAELDLLTTGIVKTDSVPNDSVFRDTFPYLGVPNPKPRIRR